MICLLTNIKPHIVMYKLLRNITCLIIIIKILYSTKFCKGGQIDKVLNGVRCSFPYNLRSNVVMLQKQYFCNNIELYNSFYGVKQFLIIFLVIKLVLMNGYIYNAKTL